MQPQNYIGRFAPTPSGSLHFGSIVAALGSYLQARYRSGLWLVRIDDVDITRSRKGADRDILQQLESLGLQWDRDVIYQSGQTDKYRNALQRLQDNHLLYVCQCTRKQVGKKPYPGTCRKSGLQLTHGRALRINTINESVLVEDQLQSHFTCRLEADIGDFVVRRSDGLFAYHLATVVDDAEHGITEIVRGADLLETTPAQMYLQRCLDLPSPAYLHLPVAIDAAGKKLSKRDQAVAVSDQDPALTLRQALQFLGQELPESAAEASPDELLAWAVEHWDFESIPAQSTIKVG